MNWPAKIAAGAYLTLLFGGNLAVVLYGIDYWAGEYTDPRPVTVIRGLSWPRHGNNHYTIRYLVGDDERKAAVNYGVHQRILERGAVLWTRTGFFTGIRYDTNHITAPDDVVLVEAPK